MLCALGENSANTISLDNAVQTVFVVTRAISVMYTTILALRARTAKLAALGDVVVKLVQLAESAASACGVRDGGGRTIETPTCEDGTVPLAKRSASHDMGAVKLPNVC
jgi:hypothetical protein